MGVGAVNDIRGMFHHSYNEFFHIHVGKILDRAVEGAQDAVKVVKVAQQLGQVFGTDAPQVGIEFFHLGKLLKKIHPGQILSKIEQGVGDAQQIVGAVNDISGMFHHHTAATAFFNLGKALSNVQRGIHDAQQVAGAVNDIRGMFGKHHKTATVCFFRLGSFLNKVNQGLGDAQQVVGAVNDISGMFHHPQADVAFFHLGKLLNNINQGVHDVQQVAGAVNDIRGMFHHNTEYFHLDIEKELKEGEEGVKEAVQIANAAKTLTKTFGPYANDAGIEFFHLGKLLKKIHPGKILSKIQQGLGDAQQVVGAVNDIRGMFTNNLEAAVCFFKLGSFLNKVNQGVHDAQQIVGAVNDVRGMFHH